MNQKIKFILICAVSVLFVVILIVAVFFTVQNHKNANNTTDIPETVSESVIKDKTDTVTERITESDGGTLNQKTTDYEIEAENKPVEVEGLTDKEQKFLGKDIDILKSELNTFIAGYGYQSAESLTLEEVEYDADTQIYTLTFKININLYKVPYVVVKYQEHLHTFDMEMW